MLRVFILLPALTLPLLPIAAKASPELYSSGTLSHSYVRPKAFKETIDVTKADHETFKQCAWYFHYFFTTHHPHFNRLPPPPGVDQRDHEQKQRNAENEFDEAHRLENNMNDAFRTWAEGIAIASGDFETNMMRHEFAISIMRNADAYRGMYIDALAQSSDDPNAYLA